MLGLVFAALIAAIIASTASKINSIATIFTLDLYAKLQTATRARTTRRDRACEKKLVLVGRIAAVVAIVSRCSTARPLLGSFDQAFQYIQEFTGFFTPGITVIFLLGLFWKRATEAGALVARGGVGGRFSGFAPDVVARCRTDPVHEPDVDRVPRRARAGGDRLAAAAGRRPTAIASRREGVDLSRPRPSFNIAAVGVILILIALYATWW